MSASRRLPSSSVKAKPRSGGFTLIELVVVMALMGIMLSFAVPNFQHLFTDDMRKTSQWILLQVPKYRLQAVTENQIYALHVDMNHKRLWFSDSHMTDDQLQQAAEQGLKLPDAIQFLDVLYSSGERIESGEAVVCFYPKGYSDQAILHLAEEDGRQRSFEFEPFLSQVEMSDGYADFED